MKFSTLILPRFQKPETRGRNCQLLEFVRKNLFLIIILFPLVASAQKKKGYSRIYASGAVQYYYDQASVKYNGIPPGNLIRAKNTIGYDCGLQYERITRYGLSLSFGMQYGVRRYDVSVYQDMSVFDPNAVSGLKGAIFTNSTKLSVSYLGYRLMVGYRRQLNKSIAVTVKAGVALKNFYDGIWEDRTYFIRYVDDSGVYVTAQFADIEKNIGRDNSVKRKRLNFPNGPGTFELYIGAEREINGTIIKRISIGIEANRNWWLWLNDGEMTVSSSQTLGQFYSVRGHFYDRNISIGLRLSVGLWR